MPDLDQLSERPASLDLDHPLAEYGSRLRGAHARTVREYFEELLRRSGVDEQDNIRIVAELRALEGDVARRKSARRGWWFTRAAGIIVAVAAAAAAFAVQGWTFLLLVLTVAAFLFDVAKIRGTLAGIRCDLQGLVPRRDAKHGEAWAQMEPLNLLHTRGVAAVLFQQTLPAVHLDSHMSSGRLADLVVTYGLAPHFPACQGGRSVLFPQSGSMAGNPFVVQRSLRHWMGQRTYHGSRVIHWTERVRNPDGNYVTVQRSQTLTASVVKPCPAYQEGTALIYGHEAAPALSFNRGPSRLAGLGDGHVATFAKNRKIAKAERQARRAVKSGRSQFTVMANTEFEALFGAADRDDEVAFRLLFTPLAQQEMVDLLADHSRGFGDDFFFRKGGMVNVVEPKSLHATRLDDDPGLFRSLEVAEARRVFVAFHERYFRALYFSLAPLLTIPLYREQRSIAEPDGLRNAIDTCEWEHEAMANLIGEAAFKHPASVTRNVLKTTSFPIAPAVHSVEVDAYGYRGVPRVDSVPVRGGDGRVHNVSVPWTQYLNVHAQRSMLVGVVRHHPARADAGDADLEREWDDALRRYGADPGSAVRRGTVAACLVGG